MVNKLHIRSTLNIFLDNQSEYLRFPRVNMFPIWDRGQRDSLIDGGTDGQASRSLLEWADGGKSSEARMSRALFWRDGDGGGGRGYSGEL